ncbi:unnamed protein product, partial [Mesorhabditis spiculigera]
MASVMEDEPTLYSLGEMSIAESSSSLAENQPSDVLQKVYYYIDEKKTPYVIEIPDTPSTPTLGDFLAVFSFANRGYKYYCKAIDKDLGCEVKLELPDDHCKLKKSSNGLFELFLLSLTNGSGTLPRHSGTLPRKMGTKQGDYGGYEGRYGERVPMRRRRSLEALDSAFAASVPSVSSRGTTVLSRRAGEHLAEFYTSNSEDPYGYNENSRLSSITDSSHYDTVAVRPGERRKRKPRKERYRKAYVPSTISSVTESSRTSLTLPQIMEIRLPLDENSYLGICVVPFNGAVIISDITPGSVVAQDGRINVGDQIISVNQQSFEHFTEQEAIECLRRVAHERKPLTLYVAKGHLSDSYTETLTTLTAGDQTMPLDIPTWVSSAAHYTERIKKGLLPDETTSEMERTFGEGTLDAETDDEEEQRLYYERRNGAPLPRSALDEAERRRENQRNEQRIPSMDPHIKLSYKMDPAVVLRAAARPDSGLVIKDRKWLKIPVPKSFVGSHFIEWLLQHVGDLQDRKDAKKYAAQLLGHGYIKHVVSKKLFTAKCYYVFDEARLGSECQANTSGGTGKIEATTEITYCGSPTTRGRLMNGGAYGAAPSTMLMNPLNNGDMTQQTWPISPITLFTSRPMNGRLRECESPGTNDYASMVGESVFGGPSHGRGVMMSSRGHQSGPVSNRAPPPNTPLCGSSLMAPPHPSPAETEFEDDDRRRILNNA